MSVDRPYKIFFTPRSLRDLEEIADALFDETGLPSHPLLDRIVAAIDLLAMFPHRTVIVPAKAGHDAVRTLPEPPYVVYFRANDKRETVRILRVRHGARRPLKRFE